jgi:hypothetical protein
MGAVGIDVADIEFSSEKKVVGVGWFMDSVIVLRLMLDDGKMVLCQAKNLEKSMQIEDVADEIQQKMIGRMLGDVLRANYQSLY